MTRENEKEGVGVVVASHCGVAQEMLRATELIVGPLQGFRAVSIAPHQPMEDTVRLLRDAIKEVDQSKGVLILTDLFGGTPANLSLSFLSSKVEVVFGVNLPMLIKLAGICGTSTLHEVAQAAKEYGQRHISIASEVLSKPAKTA